MKNCYRKWMLPIAILSIFAFQKILDQCSYLTNNNKNILLIYLFAICVLMITKISINSKLHKWFVSLISLYVIFIYVEILNGSSGVFVDFKILLMNYLLYFIIFWGLTLLFNNKISIIIFALFSYIVGVINYFLINFRGRSIQPNDIKSIKTALNVSNNYEYSIDYKFMLATMIFILLITFWLSTKIEKEEEKKKFLIPKINISLILGIVIIAIMKFSFLDKIGIESIQWYGSRTNGLYLNYVVDMVCNSIDKPNDYSINNVNKIEKSIKDNNKNSVEKVSGIDKDIEENFLNIDKDIKPNIIAIMDESFSDLAVLGEFETNEDYMPFIRQLEQNTTKGYALSSVYGGNTANSEFEFLTGNTMAFMPSDSVPYQSYINSEIPSLVSVLKDQGYKTIAMHPYFSSSWNRVSIYNYMGFDKQLYDNEFDNYDNLRLYKSDKGDFERVIEEYENKEENESLFIFNVTIQNHGGYSKEFGDFDRKISLPQYDENDFFKTHLYLSLIKETDQAVEELIEYFSSVDEPTLIVFFGDHQPSIDKKFIENVMQKRIDNLSKEEVEKLYTVPFFIWTNYESESKNVDITSINYLSTMVLDKANLKKTKYQEFLSQLNKQIPAINSQGYYDNNGKFHELENSFSYNYDNKLLNKYEILQYNNIFDVKNRNNSFFNLNK